MDRILDHRWGQFSRGYVNGGGTITKSGKQLCMRWHLSVIPPVSEPGPWTILHLFCICLVDTLPMSIAVKPSGIFQCKHIHRSFIIKLLKGCAVQQGRPHRCPPTFRLLLTRPFWDFITGRFLLSLKQTKNPLHGQMVSARISTQVLAPCRPSNKVKSNTFFLLLLPAMWLIDDTSDHIALRRQWAHSVWDFTIPSTALLNRTLKKTHLSFTKKGFLSFALFCFGFTSMSDLDLSPSSLRFPLELMGVSWVHRTRIESNQNQNYLQVCTQIAKFQLPSQYFGSASLYIQQFLAPLSVDLLRHCVWLVWGPHKVSTWSM